MGFGVGIALGGVTSGSVALGTRLAIVVPSAERLEVVVFVAATGDDVIDLICGALALDAAGVAGLAAVAVAAQRADAAQLPVGRELVTTV